MVTADALRGIGSEEVRTTSRSGGIRPSAVEARRSERRRESEAGDALTQYCERFACPLDDLHERLADAQAFVELPPFVLAGAHRPRFAIALSRAGIDLEKSADHLLAEDVDQARKPLYRIQVQERILFLDRLDEDVENGRQQRRIGRQERRRAVEDEGAEQGETLRADGKERVLQQLEGFAVLAPGLCKRVRRIFAFRLGVSESTGCLAEGEDHSGFARERRDEL